MKKTVTSTCMSYDQRSFVINGERTLLISGEVHYARSPRELWPAILDRSVECGLNCIATYIFWNAHEPRRGEFDFSGDRDLGHFLSLCAERHLYVILRMGPYCCAEWNYGGYPSWLRDEPGIVIRTWNEPYLQRVEAYFQRLCAEVRPFLATRGGPVILCQVENEYANVAKRYGADGQRYLEWMADVAKRLGVEVPIIMCEGGAEGAIDTVNGFSISDERLREFRERHPAMPIIWTEFWPGWYETWGFQRHDRDPRNMAFHLLRFLARGGSGWNYYMWHAGTNFGRTSMYLQATAYGFDAPLDEYGRITAKAAFLARLHRILQQHAPILLEGERRTAVGGDGVEATTWRLGALSLQLRLTSSTAQLLDSGSAILFDTAATGADVLGAPATPLWVQHCQLDKWQECPEPFPSDRDDGVQAERPVEQLTLTRDQSDYCWYSTMLHVESDGPVTLEIPYGGDLLYAYLDEKLVAQTQAPFRENRGPTMPGDNGPAANDLERQVRDGFRHVFTFPAVAGTHRLDILAVALGLVKGDWQIAGPMNTERKGIWQEVLANGRVVTGWTMRPFLHWERQDAMPWRGPVAPPRPCTWYRTSFALPAPLLEADADFRLDATGLGKGLLFMNGHGLGRYWLLPGAGYGADAAWQDQALDGLSLGPPGEPTQRYYHVPRAWLKAQNELVIFEEQPVAPGLIRMEARLT